jgi:hypothetical protein
MSATAEKSTASFFILSFSPFVLLTDGQISERCTGSWRSRLQLLLALAQYVRPQILSFVGALKQLSFVPFRFVAPVSEMPVEAS